jgi:hypothetical protein
MNADDILHVVKDSDAESTNINNDDETRSLSWYHGRVKVPVAKCSLDAPNCTKHTWVLSPDRSCRELCGAIDPSAANPLIEYIVQYLAWYPKLVPNQSQ